MERSIDPNDLLYAEAYRDKTSFVLSGERVDSSIALSDAEPMLIPFGFFRCHRNYVVAFRKITYVGREFVTMENGDSIPLSMQRREEFLKAYREFMGAHAQ